MKIIKIPSPGSDLKDDCLPPPQGKIFRIDVDDLQHWIENKQIDEERRREFEKLLLGDWTGRVD